jgi:membrane protein implicated in regulation of membrane protease activity
MKYGLITVLICIVIFETFEHIILPLFWMIRYRKRNSAYGPTGMIGKKCTVQQWNGTSGKVKVGAELWNASSPSPLIPGDEPVIKSIEGLTLRVSSQSERLPDLPIKRFDKDHADDSSK